VAALADGVDVRANVALEDAEALRLHLEALEDGEDAGAFQVLMAFLAFYAFCFSCAHLMQHFLLPKFQ
jgi:hypothetical protein